MIPTPLHPSLPLPTIDRYSAFPDETSDKKALEHYFIQLLDQLLQQRNHKTVAPAKADKWLAVSSLHKSIRRGEVELALRATSTLLIIDPDYFFRRLPVIAFEDIGIANPLLCALVLFASTKRVQSAYSRDQLGYLLVEQMTTYVKSRTATDIYCLTLSDPCAKSIIASCLKLSPAKLVDITLDTELNLTLRMTAIRLITGYSIRGQNGFRKTVTKPNQDLIVRICEGAQLPLAISHLVITGNHKTEGLNGALLLAYEMLSNSIHMKTITSVMKNCHSWGILHAALDQYCRAGRTVIAELIASSRILQDFLSQNPVQNPARLVGILLYQIEGCAVDKQLSFDGMFELQKEVERMELLQTGLKTIAAADSLRELLKIEMTRLNSIQRKTLIICNG